MDVYMLPVLLWLGFVCDFWIAGQPHESDSREWWKDRTIMVGDIPKRKGKGGRDGFLESRWKGMEGEGRAEL